MPKDIFEDMQQREPVDILSKMEPQSDYQKLMHEAPEFVKRMQPENINKGEFKRLSENVPRNALKMALDLPKQIGGAVYNDIFDPVREIKNYGVGGLKFLRTMANAPSTITNALSESGFISKNLKDKVPRFNDKYDFAKMMNMGEERAGDAFQQGFVEYGPALGAGRLLSGSKMGELNGLIPKNLVNQSSQALSIGTYGGLTGENPVESALSLMAFEGLLKGATKGTVKTFGKVAEISEPMRELIKRQFGSEEAIARQIFGKLSPEESQRMMENFERSQRLGVLMTPAEASGSVRQTQHEASIGKTEAGGNKIIKFKQDRKLQEKKAVNELYDTVSDKPEVAGKAIKDTAKLIIDEKLDKLKNEAEPYYKQSEHTLVPEDKLNPVTMTYENHGNRSFNTLMNDSNIAKAYKTVMNDPLYATEIANYPHNSIKVLDQVKKEIDKKIESQVNSKSPNKNTIRLLNNAKRKLLRVTDHWEPNYKKARSIYEEGSPAIERLQSTKLGQLARIRDLDVKNVPQRIFDPAETDIKVLTEVRDAIQAENPKAWKDITRQQMEKQLRTKTVRQTGNAGKNIYDQILNDDPTYKRYQEALKGNEEALSKMADMKEAFSNLLNYETPRTIYGKEKTSMNKPRSTFQALEQVFDWAMRGKYDKAAIDIITNPRWDKIYEKTIRGKSQEIKTKEMAKLLEESNKALKNNNKSER